MVLYAWLRRNWPDATDPYRGDDALVEYDQKFVDILRINLELVRDFVFVFLKLAEEKMDILLTNNGVGETELAQTELARRSWRDGVGSDGVGPKTELARRSWRDGVGETELAQTELASRRSWPDGVGETELARRSWRDGVGSDGVGPKTELARRSWRDGVGETELAQTELASRRSWPDGVGETELTPTCKYESSIWRCKEALNLSPVAMFKRSQNKSTGKAKVIYGIDQSEGIAGPSASNQQQNVSEQYHQDLTKLELGNKNYPFSCEFPRWLLAGPSAAQQQQNVSEQYLQGLTKLELENRLLKAQLMQKDMMDEINGLKMKVAKMEQQQKEDDLVGQIQELKDEQKKCSDKYEALEKELARKYVCIGKLGQLLTRIDKIEDQINGPKEISQGTSSSSMPVEEQISEDTNSTNPSGMKIDLETMDGKIITLINVQPSTTIRTIKANIERVKNILINDQRLIFDEYTLSEDRTLADYNIGNGDKIYLFQHQCGSKVIDGNDQTDGITGPSAAHQQQNVTEQYHLDLTKLELGNKLLKAELKQREMLEEIKNLKNAKMEQQQKEDGYTFKDNNRTLADYNIGNGDKIHIVAYIDWWH
ncbi:hypothetical protein niasHT_012387 [Heterodera trifolii]|uniref:Ubiquitin-like domain-containing protein n=1 Tax=Heterodera trifolii TaxID=157864 RepID=A0ABD2L2P6_9BILA